MIEGYLRCSVVSDSLFARQNTGVNSPAIIHFDLVKGQQQMLTVTAEGFEAENMSRLVMLSPADGIEGVKREVVNFVEHAGSNPCPPITVGVGIGEI